jgi:PhzF family phenazine biosynthesis protein
MSAEVLRYAAFTADGAGGNPAGVVLDAGGLTDAEMLGIAHAIGYSETAFVVRSESGSLGIRYFSPQAEVAFCGHATVATAVALADRQGVGPLTFTTLAGPVPVLTERVGGGITATLTSPPASTRPAIDTEIDGTLAAFGWSRDRLDDRFPVHVAFAGNHHLMLPVAERSVLADFDYDFDALTQVMAEHDWTTVHAFHDAGADTFDVRNAFPPGGVREDPATGAAAAAFGGYLRHIGRLSVGQQVSLRQGDDMGAPSRLTVSLEPGTESVRVSGGATQLSLSPYDEVEYP